MIKIIPPDSWDFGVPVAALVKASRAGLGLNDLATLLKRSSHPLAAWVRENPPSPGEVYAHAITLGATDVYGGNRNADRYSHDMLTRDHSTYEGVGTHKAARAYRDHKNTDPSRSYGIVKKAHYDPHLKRGEIIVAYNGSKEAAHRNGGLVAHDEIEDLERGRLMAGSQSCLVPTDVCTSCGNRARHRREYCGPANCKYGGCRDNLGRTFDDGFRLEVENPSCRFFDWSKVGRGADPTAFVTGKVAGAAAPGGAALAEALGLVLPPEHAPPGVLAGLAGLRKAAALEADPSPDLLLPCGWADVLAARGAAAPSVSGDAAARHRKVAALAAAGLLLPPGPWLAAVAGLPYEKAAAWARDTRVSVGDFLARPDRCSRAADGLSDCHPADVPNGYAPTPESDRRLAVRLALGSAKAASAAAPRAEPLPPNVSEEIAAGYLGYAAATLGLHAGTPREPLLARDLVRNLAVRPY